MYSEQLLHYFNQPKHSGKLTEANASAEVGSREEGRLLVLAMVIENNQAREARFQAHGCPVTIACGEYAAAWVERKDIDQIKTFTAEILLEALEIPSHKHYCALMAEDAIQHALSTYQES